MIVSGSPKVCLIWLEWDTWHEFQQSHGNLWSCTLGYEEDFIGRGKKKERITWIQMQNQARCEIIFSFSLFLSSRMSSHLKTKHFSIVGYMSSLSFLMILTGRVRPLLVHMLSKAAVCPSVLSWFLFSLVYNCFCMLWAQLLILSTDLKVALHFLFCSSSLCQYFMPVLLFL